MLPKTFIKRALCFSFLIATQANAAAFQILDDKTLDCIDVALNAVDIPNAQFSSPNYGEIRESGPIGGQFIAAASVFTYMHDGVSPSTVQTFSARIMWDEGGGYYFTSIQSISTFFNEEGQLTRINEGGFTSAWNISGYQSYTHGLVSPEYSEEQNNLIREWVQNAARNMALFGTHCLTGDIIELASGEDIIPPPQLPYGGLTLSNAKP